MIRGSKLKKQQLLPQAMSDSPAWGPAAYLLCLDLDSDLDALGANATRDILLLL